MMWDGLKFLDVLSLVMMVIVVIFGSDKMVYFSGNTEFLLSGDDKYIAFSKDLIKGMLSWAVGLCLCVVAYGTTYLSQKYEYLNFCRHTTELKMAFLNDESYVMPTSNGALLWQYGSVVAIVLSYVALWLGMYWSYAAIYMLIGR